MHELLTVGSVVLAIVNVGVMWAIAHQWRYAWHSNLGLQLLWLPYDYLTGQYGLLGLGFIITFVSLKGAFRENQLARAAERSQPAHRRRRQRGGPQPAVSPAPAHGPRPAVPSTAAPGPEVAAEAAGLPGHGAARAVGLADGEVRVDLAGVSVSSSAAVPTDCDGDDPKRLPATPRIPQQSDRRTALDGERRPHFQ
jgi:hypothetical protein